MERGTPVTGPRSRWGYPRVAPWPGQDGWATQDGVTPGLGWGTYPLARSGWGIPQDRVIPHPGMG